MAGRLHLKETDFERTRSSGDVRSTSKGRPPVSTPSSVRANRLQRILSLLESRLPRSVRELAGQVNLSPSHLHRLFKQETGVHLNDVVRERRLAQAAELLINTEMGVKEIAYFVGYGHHASFIRAFQRRFGHSPKRYRQSFVGQWASPHTSKNPDKLETDDSLAHEPLKVIQDVVTVARLEQKLGLQKRLVDETDLVSVIEDGLPLTAISSLMDHGIYEKEIYSLVIPRRTLQHRRARKEKLSVEESDRAARIARLTTLAERVFADGEAGMRWLRAPKRRFTGRTPMEMLATEAGSRLVEEMLYQLDEGMAA